MGFRRIVLNSGLALLGVGANKLRAFLTGLGILFGVGAVICMLAIGTGARQNILEQLSLIGTNNIVVNAIDVSEDAEESDDDEEDETAKFSPGLNLDLIYAIKDVLPGVEAVGAEVGMSQRAIYRDRMLSTRAMGVNNDFFAVNNLTIRSGTFFTDNHLSEGRDVAIVGDRVARYLFQNEDPVGSYIKVGQIWLQIIGVLSSRTHNEALSENFGLRDVNSDIYVPVQSFFVRFKNRGAISEGDIDRRGRREGRENYHQLDRLTVKLKNSEQLTASASIIATMLERLNNENKDFYLDIPELLLEQQRQTQDTFNLVLAVIAAISLLVGGIGIMNIMLASVMERTREIGIRRSVGATEGDIRMQFLMEAVFISLFGGLLGIGFGIAAAEVVTWYSGIPAIVTAWSVILSFGVATLIGLAFGYFPASRAAKRDPIQSLRVE
ncbi:MAG: FtsX-like permease family protein [Saprospirales bacterium]|nr:MAG: FtsX-like permease family protein [Saprospirales bacterium]